MVCVKKDLHTEYYLQTRSYISGTTYNHVDSMKQLIDSKKIMKENRVCISDNVRLELGVQMGDYIEFVRDEYGNIYVQKAQA